MDFQPEKESWDSYTERLEHFFTATRMIDDDKKVFTLIHQNGPPLFTLLKELSFPRNPTQMSYDEIKHILKRHYVGSRSVLYERKVFYSAQMKPNESASEWHRRLKALVINCKFGGFLEEILVDKFVTGFKGKVLQRLCEKNEDLSLQEALEIAQRYENISISLDKTKEGTERSSSESRQESTPQHVGQKHQQQPRQESQQYYHKQQQQKSQQGHQQQQQQHRQPRQQQQTQKEYQQQHKHQPQQQSQQNYSMQQQQKPQQECKPQQHRQPRQEQAQKGYQQYQHQQQQPQHINQQQRQHRPEQPQGQQFKNVPTCYKCGKRGHTANVCRSRIQRNSDSDWETVDIDEVRKPECCIA